MDKTIKMNFIEMILQSCMFSEYLPGEFSTQLLTKSELDISSKDSLPPVIFSMDKFNDLNNRRFISIPEIGSFVAAVQSFAERDILEKLIELNNADEHSLSKFMVGNKGIRKFSDKYGFSIETVHKEQIANENRDSDFLNNLQIKLRKSKACKCILHLDIANFFSSIYTHNIAALTQGEKWANVEYQKYLANDSKSKPEMEYLALKSIDNKIAEMNSKRTHGLLMGPRLSFIIAESLLTQIDNELHGLLSKYGIDFVRYVDDYDVFIKNDEQIKITKDVFNEVLQRYGLIINDSKTKIEEFPFYTFMDYSVVVDDRVDLCNQYARFGQIEKSKTQNGALLYFCENILSCYTSDEMALSLSFSILKNVSKALMSSCRNISRYSLNKGNVDHIMRLMLDCIRDFSSNKFDLESIWTVYTYLKLFPKSSFDVDILCNLHEIALVVYLYESSCKSRIKEIIEFGPQCGWLLNYELFFNGYISESTLKDNLKVSDITSYKKLKDKSIHFYVKPKKLS